jgi:hypothetical protein
MKPVVAISIAAIAIITVLAAENYRMQKLVAEIATKQMETSMLLTKANIRMEQMSQTIHALRTGRID